MNAIEPNNSTAKTASSRRSYLGWLASLWTAGVAAALGVPLVRFLTFPLRAQTTSTQWSDVGPISELASLTVPVQRLITVEQVDGWRSLVSEKPVYVTKNSTGQFEVLSAVCPHLGCSVQWRDSQHEFQCPCHGARYAVDGSKVGAPAPRALDSLETKTENGRLLTRYQYFRNLEPTKEVMS